MYENRMAALMTAQENSKLPAELDRAAISEIITEAQLEFWDEQWSKMVIDAGVQNASENNG